MGRGRKPKPTVFKMLQGNPGKRKLNDEEPDFGMGAPPRPTWLDRYAKQEWDRLSEILVSARVLTKGEIGVLAVACDAYSQLRQCKDYLKKTGSLSYATTLLNGDKVYRPYPEAIRRESARKQYLSSLAELGLTPSSRTKVKRIPEKQIDGVKRLLG